ncbi:pyridoxal phosphate-dependent aminotransferase (plasmid) [Rhizobium sp. NIBRBAC000502774]|nr:pyridoxal phosphate-dependent aminotransferase [Rhizobium sp. NIBRBAC000502774]
MIEIIMRYDFNEILDRRHLSSKKWEGEIDRLNDPSLLCLGTAEMDFRSAPPIVRALEEIARSGYFGYPYKRDSYYEATIGFLARRFGWTVKREWIHSHVGIYPSIQPLIEELTEPGDEILYQTPVHSIFQEIIESAGRRAIPNPLVTRSHRYEIDFDGLEKAITAKTRMLLFCSPHNPVGRVWTKTELEQLNAIVLRHKIVVVSDEVYCGLIYPGQRHIPLASLSKEASLNTVTLISASKSFNTTGLKHSLVIAENPDLQSAFRQGMKRGNLYFASSIFGEAATEAAFRDCDDWSAELMRYVEANFRFLKDFLAHRIPAVQATEPEGGYFAWLDFSNLGLTVDGLKQLFEFDARVVVSMGEPMGPGGTGHVRINLGCPKIILEQALERIAAACSKLKDMQT